MKELTIQDATKDELIQYFFTPDGFGGGFRIPAAKDSFLLWLNQKRDGELLDAIDTSIDASQKALHEYVELVKQMNAEKDIDKKLEIAEKANKAYERYEKAEKRQAKLEKKLGY
jgi:hypothetical protein